MSEYTDQVLMGIDLGATGIKAAAFSLDGKLIASASRRNGPVKQPGGKEGWLIWDADDIWNKGMPVYSGGNRVSEITISDRRCGRFPDSVWTDAPVDRDGNLLYPLSSWHDSRNLSETEWLTQQIEPYEIYEITGFHKTTISNY